MRIGGLQKFTLIDYPGKMACTIFTQGCNFRCLFCYNKELVLPECYVPVMEESEIFSFLESRRNKLQGVVLSGGEPTIQGDCPDFIQKIRHLGFPVKLDTNGSRPDILHRLIDDNLVDYVAMDIKAPLQDYSRVADVPVDTDAIRQSITLLESSGVAYEFRTTLVKGIHDLEKIREICRMVRNPEQITFKILEKHGEVIDQKLFQENDLYTEDFLKRLPRELF